MAALNVESDGFRRTGELIDLAGTLLGADFDDDAPVPPCAADPASQAIMDNLNARRSWLLQHVRAGAEQAGNAATGMRDTATSYVTEDQSAAGTYNQFGGSSHGGSAVGTVAIPASSSKAPAAMPRFASIPDVSGTEGEMLAQQLESGAGPLPATAAATKLVSLATRAQAANAALADAHTQLLATGESAATPGAAEKLTRAMAWTEAVGTHASVLAAGYESAGNLHALTSTQVGPSAGWVALKTGLADAQVENALNGGLSQSKVDAFKQALDDKERIKGAAAGALQTGGEIVSAPPGDLPQPGMESDGESTPGDGKKADKKGDKERSLGEEPGSGMQDMLQPLMGALGPLTQSLGKANPLQSVGQMAQQLGQQVGKLGSEAAKKAASPLNPAALAKPLAAAGKGGSGGAGGGSPIKPSSNLGAAMHAASLSGTPAATSPSVGSAPLKPAGADGASRGAGAGGMMPMGHKPGGDAKSSKINSYEEPLPDVDDHGRPGVVGETAKPAAPVVNPEATNAVKERLARRKKDAVSDGNG
ncbi:Fis family transcriptional regulator [Mycolicibacterium neoaurum]|uniref:Fis family transcriptional regulator n=1 Tax=Mycolicibacterium neoaurum TaxID=1795 RepID=UPI001F4D32CE|nr:Fis family transcriptional regulator [Mycolicibacterium neoaurum]